MLISYAAALLTLLAVLCGWLVVQLAWKKMFAPTCGDPDALAGRLGCHGAGHGSCSGACATKKAERSDP